MTKLDKTALSTLILKMVGGKLDGKRLKVTTQKCFLTGGDNPNSGQCTIVRGPEGTQLRATSEVYVNGIPGTLHWLKEGDGIEIGQMRMVVQQLGHYPETIEKRGEASEAVSKPTESAAVETEASGRAPNAAQNAPLQTTGGKESNDQGKPHSDQPIESTPKSKDTSPASSGTTDSPSTKKPTIAAIRSSLSEEEKTANEARLERALQSLAGIGEDSTSPQTTENLVDQRLDALENELESHEKSYSEPMPNSNVPRRALAPTIFATSNENYAPTEGAEDVEDDPQTAASEINTSVENEAAESNDLDEAFEPTAETARQALPPLLAPLSMLKADAEKENELSQSTSESTPPQTVESTSDSASDSASDDNEILDEEQAKLDEIMQRLGVGTGNKDESESTDTSEDDQPPVSEQSTSLEASPDLETTEPTVAATEEEVTKEETAVEEAALEETAEEEAAVEETAEEEATEEVTESADTAETQSESVADILARMKSEGKLDDFDTPSDDSAASLTAEVAEPAPTPEPVPEPVSQPSEQQESDLQQSDSPEGDVQDYMNQLFQRLRGDDAGAAEAAAPTPDKPKPAGASKPEASSQPKPEAPPKPRPAILEESEFIPKQRAPEAHTDIRALRQLANKQKTNAVSDSFQAKSKFEQSVTSYVAGGALAATVAFGWIAKSIYDPAGILAVICFVISIVALIRYLSNLKKSKESQ